MCPDCQEWREECNKLHAALQLAEAVVETVKRRRRELPYTYQEAAEEEENLRKALAVWEKGKNVTQKDQP